jgi:hypothetical protein
MAIVISAAAQLAMLDALTAQINGGSGDTYGDFQLLTNTDNPLAEVIFGNPAFGAATGSGPVTAVQSGTTITTASLPTSGNIGKGKFRNRSNTAVVSFDIGVGTGYDLQVGSVTIGTGASSVDISGLTITLTVV